MRGGRVRKRKVSFDEGYTERNRAFLWLYRRYGNRSARVRHFIYWLPASRFRMSLVGRFAHHQFRAWSEEQFDLLMPMMHPKMRVNAFGLGTYEGPEGLRAGWAEWQSSFGKAKIEVSEVIDDRTGDVVIVGRGVGFGFATGAEHAQPGAVVWTHEDGMAVEARFYSSKSEALEAAGLSE